MPSHAGAVRTAGCLAALVFVVGNATATAQPRPNPVTTDHYVSHFSSVPAIGGEPVQLYVRERPASPAAARSSAQGVVLFVNPGNSPSAQAFDLPFMDYSLMGFLAAAGFDVFAMDLTGYGWSTRPWPMNDPCNATAEQQKTLSPYPLTDTCEPSYPYRLLSYASQLDDIDAVVTYLKTIRGVERVSLVAWSAGASRFGGYAALHPESVETLVLLQPIYDRGTPSEPTVDGPEPGPSMNIASQSGNRAGQLNPAEQACGNSYEPGVIDSVRAINREFDPVGAHWGNGVVRAPTSGTPWGWNATLASRITAPTLLISAEFDLDAPPQMVRDLYADLGAERKVQVDLACSSHQAQLQSRYKLVHQAILDWLLHGALDGQTIGSVRKGD